MSDHPTIGASQIAAILGLSPFKGHNQHSVWMKLVHGVEQEDNESLERGRRIEPMVLDAYERKYKIEVKRNDQDPPRKRERGYLHATPDGWTQWMGNRLVEAKTSREKWDVLPVHYHHQLQVQLYCWPEYACADLAVLYPNYDFEVFPDIQPDPELQGQLHDAAEKFIKDYVIPKKLPPVDGSESCREAIVAQWPKPESEAYLEASSEVEEVLLKLRDEQDIADRALEYLDTHKNQLREFIKDHPGCTFSNGRVDFKRNKDSEKVDYERAFKEIKSKSNEAYWEKLLKKHTGIKQGPRVLRIHWNKGGEDGQA